MVPIAPFPRDIAALSAEKYFNGDSIYNGSIKGISLSNMAKLLCFFQNPHSVQMALAKNNSSTTLPN
jgi:hypothetical protein